MHYSQTWKHASCLDMRLYILNVHYLMNKDVRVRAIAHGPTGIVYDCETYVIKHGDLHKWQLVPNL